MGHDGYLNGAYVPFTVEQLEQYYREAESVLWIFREPPINTEELKRVESENERLKDELGDIRRQVAAVGEARAHVGSYLDVLLLDPEGNAAKLRRLKEVLSEL